jgi:hypothetical protein
LGLPFLGMSDEQVARTEQEDKARFAHLASAPRSISTAAGIQSLFSHLDYCRKLLRGARAK